MLITKKHLLTMFTMAGILVAASSVNAASIVNGDLLLGFRVTGGTGAGTDLIVRAGASGAAGIGNAVTFRDATTTIATVVDVGAEAHGDHVTCARSHHGLPGNAPEVEHGEPSTGEREQHTAHDAHFGTLRKRLFLLGIELADALFEARETFEGGDLFVSVHGAHGRGETSRPEG